MSKKANEQPTGDSNRYIHVGVMAVALILAGTAWWKTRDLTHPPTPPKPTLYPGKVIDAAITLVTADKWDLACASNSKVGDFHCQYKDEKNTAWPNLNVRDSKQRKNLLAPYMTIDNQMFLIPGLFEEPAIATRYRDELPFGKSRNALERFTAQCKLKVVKKLDGVRVRWDRKAAWQAPTSAWVGTIGSCQINDY